MTSPPRRLVTRRAAFAQTRHSRRFNNGTVITDVTCAALTKIVNSERGRSVWCSQSHGVRPGPDGATIKV